MSKQPDNASEESTDTVDADPITDLMKGPVTREAGASAPTLPGLVTASVVGASEAGRPLIAIPGYAEPCEALPVWMEPEPDWAGCEGLKVAIGFESESNQPLLVGVLGTPAKLKPGTSEASQDVVKITSDKELVLECGKAKIALRADGRIAILGGYVLSRSSGVNKIKGGSVQIN